MDDASATATSHAELKVHNPEEIARKLGGINLKTLSALIRNHGLETTTLGYTEPAPRVVAHAASGG